MLVYCSLIFLFVILLTCLLLFHVQNILLILCTEVGVFRAYDAIRTVTKKAGLKMPQLIRTSNMRKYFATMLQVSKQYLPLVPVS